MKLTRFAVAIAAAVLTVTLAAGAASAQATRTWVSGVGDDANPCSRTAPCKTFAGAISKTAPAGEINCLDPGGFGALTITKSITVSCETGTAGVLVSGTNGIVVAAGSSDNVFLKGLDFEGLGTGLSGVRILTAASVTIEHCVIQGFVSNPGGGVQVVATTPMKVEVDDTLILNNTPGAGIWVDPGSGGVVTVSFNNVRMANNGFGIVFDGTGGATGRIGGTVRDSTIDGSVHNGITVSNGTAPNISVLVDNVSVTNGTFGLVAGGANAGMIVGNSTISGNATGLLTSGGGLLFSYGNNRLNGNTTADGSFSSTISTQ
jgi:hypothetical protein